MFTPEFNEALTIISIAGFAVQRAIDLLDPFFLIQVDKWKKRRPDETLPWGWSDKEAKAWLIAIIGLILGGIIAIFTNVSLLSNTVGGVVDKVIIAFAIGTGSNALNTVVKFGDYAKEARKADVSPLPTVTIIPSPVTVAVSSQIQLFATVTGAENKEVRWSVLEISAVGNIFGSIDANTGIYTAPSQKGTYHIAATSLANEAVTTVTTVTVE